MKINWLVLSLGILLLAGCTSDDCDSDPQKLVLNISIESTRIAKEEFNQGDNIGLYLVDYANGSPGILGNASTARATNIKYTYDNSFWYAEPGKDIFLEDNYSDLYVYYPYDEEMSSASGKTDLTAYPFSIQPDQRISSEENDFLWGKTEQLSASNNRAIIIFRHLMSRCEINLKFNDAQEITWEPDLTIYNTKTNATINLRVGSVTPVSGTEAIKPFVNLNTKPGFDITYNAIILPQTIPSGTPLFTVNNGTEILQYVTETEIVIKPQSLYTFNLTVGDATINRRL
ncbi:fimbrillin family protein [Prevotella sp. 10(H)]|uniref:fimbrillin family protein n=1 Tax=Prevotella sp. 10(H) TaxID=1158294 RepID=UPI0004A714B6|nr:fimbrillin family protein [Prevotella sp. 10(H)]